jgi:hypothetical protein
MQVAFLIYAGRAIQRSVRSSKAEWAQNLRSVERKTLFANEFDAAFYGKHSLLATDQGVRGLLQITNDLCYTAAEDLELLQWNWETVFARRNAKNLAATDEGSVNLAIESLGRTSIGKFLDDLGKILSGYDWRTSSTPGLSEDVRLKQAVFRGSSGYKELRQQLLANVAASPGTVGKVAKDVAKTRTQ